MARYMVYSLLAYLPYIVEFDPLFALLKIPLMWSQKIVELAGNTNTLLSNPDNKLSICLYTGWVVSAL